MTIGHCSNNTTRSLRSLRSKNGFSLVELIVVLAVTGLVSTALFSVLFQSQATYAREVNQLTIRQMARVAMDRTVEEIRLAGYDIQNVPEVILQASATSLQIASDIDDGSPAAPCDATFENAPNGGVERITYSVAAGLLVRAVDCWDGTSWTNEIGKQLLATDIVNSTPFVFFDEANVEITAGGSPLSAAQRGQIRTIALQFNLLDTDTTQVIGDPHTRFQITSRVRLHNIID